MITNALEYWVGRSSRAMTPDGWRKPWRHLRVADDQPSEKALIAELSAMNAGM